MSIDLSKITPRELPKKTETVNILGTVFDQEIKPITGESRLKYWALDFTVNSGESTKDRVIIALTAGASMSSTDAVKMIALDWDAAVDLAGKIHAFTVEYETSIKEEKERAEKN